MLDGSDWRCCCDEAPWLAEDECEGADDREEEDADAKADTELGACRLSTLCGELNVPAAALGVSMPGSNLEWTEI